MPGGKKMPVRQACADRTEREKGSTRRPAPAPSKPDTAIAAAFKKAGVKTPKERLHELALTEMVAHADDTMRAIEGVWAKVQKDAPMLVALFNPYGEYRSAITQVFHRLKHDIIYEQRQPGANLSPEKKKAWKIIERDRAEQKAEEEEQRRIDREEQNRRDHEYKEYLASWHKTPLWNLTIGDKPVWQNSAGTIRAWLPTQRNKLTALEMLIEGVPDDGKPLEYYRTPEDVKAIWKIIGAKEENAQA
jgi:hypothetical protein